MTSYRVSFAALAALAMATGTEAFGPSTMMLSVRGGSPVFVSSAACSSLALHSKAQFVSPKLSLRKRSAPKNLNLEMNFVKEGAMRGIACLPYILPMMDSLAYGRFLFQKVPLLAVIFMKPLQPFIDMAQAFPMMSFVAFLGLFLFVVRNKKIPRFIRFNTMQALLLEILLIFPQILTSGNMGGLIPFVFTEFVSNMTFYAIASIVGYSCFSNLMGELPCKIPVISTAVFQQIGGGYGYED